MNADDPDFQEPLSTLSESSFVILGQGSLPAYVNDDLNKNTSSDSFSKSKSGFNNYESANSENSNKFQSKLWSGSSLSQEEIQEKLEELIKENSQLKETLNQNNLAIKSQLDTFIMWQQEVLKTHETHKQKFLETKDLILKLRAENGLLKKHLEKSSGILALNDNDIYAQINKKPEDSDKLKQKIEEYKQICCDLNVKNENLDAEKQKLREELRTAENNILELKKELEDIRRKNMFLKHKNEQLKDSFESILYKSIPSSETLALIFNLFQQVELKKDKILKLAEEFKNTKLNDSEASGSELSAANSLNQYIDKSNNMNDLLENENLNKNEINEIEPNVVGEIKQLKSHLNQEQNVFFEKQDPQMELKKQFHKLLEDYKALQAKLTLLKNNDSSSEKYKEEVSSLLTKLEAKDKELISKQQECDELKKTIEKLNLECEEIAVLRIQVQLYQSDFNEERAAREKLVGEKEEMAEQIRYLQNRIKSLP